MLEIVDHKPTLRDERSVLWAPVAEVPALRGGPLFSSTPGEAAVPEFHVKESSLNPGVPPFVRAALPSNQDHQPDGISSLANTTETMVAKLTASIDSIVTKSNLPPLEVVKFSGNPCEYFRFRARFDEMVGTQNISETQKMSRLLQFLDGQARSAVAGFEVVPGGLSRALKMLQQRFGQPHRVAKGCVDALVDGPNISSNNGPGLQKFADRSRTLYETLRSMNALPEMNMTNLAKMSEKLPIALQLKWRDEALRIRERRGFPNLKDLVDFIVRRAEAANDPVFGRVGDPKEQASVNATTTEPTAPIETTSHTYSMTSRTKVALQVVPVKIMNNDGHSVTTYALLDTGSEGTFLSKTISDRLGLEVKNCSTLAVCTLSGESSVKVGQANVQVKAVDNHEDRTLTIENVKVIDNLTFTTPRARGLSQWPHLKDLKIPDVKDNQVTMLIGANTPEAQVHEECRRGRSGEPYAVRTVLGWAVLGPVNVANGSSSQVTNVNFVKYGDELSDQQMRQFLRLDDIDMNRSSKKTMSVEDQEALKRMENSVQIVDGHYEIGMLWKSVTPWLPNNKQTAEARLQALKRKLQRDETFHRK